VKPFQKVERSTLYDIVSQKLKAYIADHNLGPGDKLPAERELAVQFEVSRSVLREALRTLASTGVVTIRHGEGTFVQAPSLAPTMEHLLIQWQSVNKPLSELLELRSIVEQAAAEQAVLHATEEDVAILERLASAIAECGGDPQQLKNSDIAFHQALVQATHNGLFAQMSGIIIDYFTRLSPPAMAAAEIAQAAYDHQQIASAVKAKDSLLAKELLRRHFETARRSL